MMNDIATNSDAFEHVDMSDTGFDDMDFNGIEVYELEEIDIYTIHNELVASNRLSGMILAALVLILALQVSGFLYKLITRNITDYM